jgi:signal transduction histidine kinase
MRRRLLLSYLALTVFVLAVLELPLALNEAHIERQALATKVQRDASALAGIAQSPTGPGLAPEWALRAAAARYHAATGAAVVITRPGGRMLARTPPVPGAGRDDVLSVRAPVASGGRTAGFVMLTYPAAFTAARVHRYWALLAGIAVLVTMAALAIGLMLGRWVIRPLVALEDAARRVRGGDLGARAPVGSGPGEVSAVSSAFNATTAHLQRLVTAQREFVADASHQLRSPLAALRLRLENLDAAMPPARRSGLEGALAEVERLTHMVDGLLALARAEQARTRPVEQDVAAVLTGRLATWAAVAQERLVALSDVSAKDGVSVLASPGHLEQVLDNLLENALAVAPPGSAVAVWCRPFTGEGELGIRDQGPGLTAEDRTRAFDRFWTGGRAHGTGLGLAVVRRLVEADGGSVTLRDAPGGGLEAVVRLPSRSGREAAAGERHGGQGPSARCVRELDRGAVAVGDGAGDREAQPAPGHA